MELISENEVKYGGFWRRFIAHLIDGVVLLIITTLVMFLFTGNFAASYSFNESDFDFETFKNVFGGGLFSLIISITYYAGLHSSKHQATIGKMALDMRVVKTDGTRITFLRGVGRYFSSFLSGLIFMIGYIIAAFDKRKQALHDKLADTMVLVVNE